MGKRIRRRLLLVLLALPCLGAGGGPPGTDVSLTAGGGLYGLRGCFSTFGNRAFTGSVQMTNRMDNGLSLTAEGGVASGAVTSAAIAKGGVGVREGDAWGMAFGAARIGFQFASGGLDFGGGVVHQWGVFKSRTDLQIVPTGEAWLGSPRTLYVWGRALANGPPVPSGSVAAVPAFPPVAMGLGRRGELVHLELGLGFSGVIVESDVRVNDTLTLGTSVHVWDKEQWLGLLTVGLRFPTARGVSKE